MKNTIILFLLLVFLLNSCHSKKIAREISLNNLEIPPGTTKMEDNLFIDITEVRNLDYLEFTSWMSKVYGNESAEYRKIFPDTTVWNTFAKPLTKYYLTHPTYRNYPVVGISYEQAKLFCKWRSDRVMEYILIREGLIKYSPSPSKDSCFTIEGYYNGLYVRLDSNSYFPYYPEYSLLDSATYLKALLVTDSLNNRKIKHSINKKKIKEQLAIWCLENIPDNDSTLKYVTRDVNVNYIFPDRKFIINLQGNVRELSNDSTICLGGSFIDSCDTYKSFYKNTGVNYYTGFRSICTYKKWEQK